MSTDQPAAEFKPRPSSSVSHRYHPRCWVCGRSHRAGLQLDFVQNADGSVCVSFDCAARWEGYPGRLHGGVIAALLDGAMTNCLFAQGQVALTAELCVRYREAVVTGRPATVRAWLAHSSSRLHRVEAELKQDDRIKVTAHAKFLPAPSSFTGEPAPGKVSP